MESLPTPEQIARGAWGLVRATLGLDRTDAITLAERRKLCAACPYNVESPLGRRCRACGCIIVAKTAVADEHCPQGAW